MSGGDPLCLPPCPREQGVRRGRWAWKEAYQGAPVPPNWEVAVPRAGRAGGSSPWAPSLGRGCWPPVSHPAATTSASSTGRGRGAPSALSPGYPQGVEAVRGQEQPAQAVEQPRVPVHAIPLYP